MLDFGILPPEVISPMMYSGPGSGPMIAAASAWDTLAGQLNSFALGYSSVLSELEDQVWSGPASQAMIAAATPYVAWVTATVALAEQAANQVRAAAAAYETAFAAVVPPAVVTANRTELEALVATNFFGQNTTRIAAIEAAYAQMWAQDAAAMQGYATSASTATELTPFHQPPQTTNPAAQSAAAPAQAVNMPAVQPADSASMAEPPSVADQMINGVGNFNTLAGPESFAAQMSRTVTNAGSFFTAVGKALGGSAPKAAAAVPSVGTAGAFGSGATLARQAAVVGVGQAAPVGGLSVPKAWADATPVAAAAEEPLWLAESELAAASLEGAPEAGMVGAAPTAGMGPVTGMVGRSSVSNILRVGPRRFTMPRPSVGG